MQAGVFRAVMAAASLVEKDCVGFMSGACFHLSLVRAWGESVSCVAVFDEGPR